MQDTRLFEIFQNTKEVLCKYNYYIHMPKKILYLTNTEDKIPHLMGLQYAGKPKQHTGDLGTYLIKKGKITMKSVEKLVNKYYRTEEKRRRIFEVIHLKLDNLQFLEEMFSSYSKLYLYDVGKNENSKFDSDYLMVHEMEDRVLHLGFIRASEKQKNCCHCNSFMVTYKKDKKSDVFYQDLPKCYEINKIVREDKISKRTETIYQSMEATWRENSEIRKMIETEGIEVSEKLVKEIVKVNLKFGKYHLLRELMDLSYMLSKCTNKREEALVKSMNGLLIEAVNNKNNERRLRSIEASFKMEDMPFDSSCRKRVLNVLNNTTTVSDAIEELNRKYGVSKSK